MSLPCNPRPDWWPNERNNMNYSGNILADMLDRSRGEGILHEDHYICCECRTIVKECEWDANRKLCLECIKEEKEK